MGESENEQPMCSYQPHGGLETRGTETSELGDKEWG